MADTFDEALLEIFGARAREFSAKLREDLHRLWERGCLLGKAEFQPASAKPPCADCSECCGTSFVSSYLCDVPCHACDGKVVGRT
jgi:hypothetical protein